MRVRTLAFGMLCMAKQLKLLQILTCSHAFREEQDVSKTEHPWNDPSDYWRVSLHLVFLDHLVNEISSRVTKNEEIFLISYLLPAKLQGLIADTDRLYNAFKSDLTSKLEFVDEKPDGGLNGILLVPIQNRIKLIILINFIIY